MSFSLTRRGFIAASAAMAATTIAPRHLFAQTAPHALTAGTRTLEVNGRAATVLGLTNAQGGAGLILDPGQRFRVSLTNALDVETAIHWHGQLPPNEQDGVPGLPAATLMPGEARDYDFVPLPGTHWMHSHIPSQEMQLLAAPLIVRSAEDVAADRQEIVMFLHDFTFKTPEEVMAEIAGGTEHGMAGMDHSSMGHQVGQSPPPMAAMDHGATTDMDHGSMAGMGHGSMAGMDHGSTEPMAMDLNDFNFDAYLANDRTLADPEVIRVEAGGRIRLRVINAGAATVFWIDTGALEGRLVAVDGHGVEPAPGRRFGLAMGQRLDIELDLPAGQGAYPLLALREGARERTGIVLATPSAHVDHIEGLGHAAALAFDVDLAQEQRLRALSPLADRPSDKMDMVMLGGSMQPYVWTINGQVWGSHVPLTAQTGQRVEIMFHNMSMMGHPMHLHGHAFQVVGIGNRRFAGAVRDTVYVPPMAALTVALDAGEAARWMLHCHHMPHLSTGMMTEFAVSA